MNNAAETTAPCTHSADVGCDHCDPPGRPSSIRGDADHDFDAIDARELEAEMLAARFDDDPNVYDGTYFEGGDDW